MTPTKSTFICKQIGEKAFFFLLSKLNQNIVVQQIKLPFLSVKDFFFAL